MNDTDDISPPRGGLQDMELLTAFIDGDREAFTSIYRRHSRTIFQFVFGMTGSVDTADELTQEVFVWLIHHPNAYESKRGSLPAFLGGVARNLLRRHKRSQKRWFPLDDALQLLNAFNISDRSSPQPESALDAARVRAAINLLPIRFREAIVLCDLQEKDYAESAKIAGCSIGTIRSRLHRGRALLARKLNPPSRRGEANVK